MAEMIVRTQVKVIGLGNEQDVSNRASLTTLVNAENGYVTVGTAIVNITEFTAALNSEVQGLWIKAEAGNIYINPVASAVAVISVNAGASAYCAISAGHAVYLNKIAAAITSLFTAIRGDSSSDAFSYSVVSTT